MTAATGTRPASSTTGPASACSTRTSAPPSHPPPPALKRRRALTADRCKAQPWGGAVHEMLRRDPQGRAESPPDDLLRGARGHRIYRLPHRCEPPLRASALSALLLSSSRIVTSTAAIFFCSPCVLSVLLRAGSRRITRTATQRSSRTYSRSTRAFTPQATAVRALLMRTVADLFTASEADKLPACPFRR